MEHEGTARDQPDLDELKTKTPMEIRSRFLVLAYTRNSLKPLKKNTFPDIYDALTRYGVPDAVTIEHPATKEATC